MQPLVSDETTGSQTRSGFTHRNVASHPQAIHPSAVTHSEEEPLHGSQYCRNATYIPSAPTWRAYPRNELSLHDSCYLIIRCGAPDRTYCWSNKPKQRSNMRNGPITLTYSSTHLESHFWSPIYFRQTRLWNRILKLFEQSLINTLHSVRLSKISRLRDHVPNLCRDLIRTNNL